MDSLTPRSLGDSEDSDPERRAPGRTTPPKKSLERFLAEFEARLLADPGQPATSASAALEGRAEGAWRTPVEGAERQGRRLPRRTALSPSLPPAAERSPDAAPRSAIPADVSPPDPPGPDRQGPGIEGAAPLAENVTAEAAATAAEGEPGAGAGRRRARRHRRHRRR